MSVKTSLLVAFFAILSTLSAVQAAEQSGAIQVHVAGLKNNNGSVRIAMFNSDASYSGDKFTGDAAYKKAIVPIKDLTADCTFDNVPYGDYAIKLFHDEDNSGKFETGMFGIPKVQYGFSNNAHGKFGPAEYSKAKFTLGTGTLKMDINMQ